jgi:hypothetical protein
MAGKKIFMKFGCRKAIELLTQNLGIQLSFVKLRPRYFKQALISFPLKMSSEIINSVFGVKEVRQSSEFGRSEA